MPSTCGGSKKAELEDEAELPDDAIPLSLDELLLASDELLARLELLALAVEELASPAQTRTMIACPPPLTKKSRTE
jgi:hypothetical protein